MSGEGSEVPQRPANRAARPSTRRRGSAYRQSPVHASCHGANVSVEPRQERSKTRRYEHSTTLEILTRLWSTRRPGDLPRPTCRGIPQFFRTCGPVERVPRREGQPVRHQGLVGATKAQPVLLRIRRVGRIQKHQVGSIEPGCFDVPVCLVESPSNVVRDAEVPGCSVLRRHMAARLESNRSISTC